MTVEIAEPVTEEIVLGRGGGIYLTAIVAEIADSTITNNDASASGGGIFFTDVSEEPSIVRNCLIVRNEAGRDGGGISVNWYAKPIITNCTVADNKATGEFGTLGDSGFGGGMYCSYHSNTVVTNSIFWDNFAFSSGGQINLGTGFEFDPRPSTLDIAYSTIDGVLEETGIHVDNGCELIGQYDTFDPLFESVGSSFEGRYYLDPTSPCVDAGSGSASGYYVDAGQLEPLLSEPVHVQLSRGYTTQTDYLFDTETVDIGYHYPMVFAGICGLCDVDPNSIEGSPDEPDYIAGDGMINLADFAKFALNWGMADCGTGNGWCDGTDVTVDTLVNSYDLFVFTNCWLEKDEEAPGYATRSDNEEDGDRPQLVWLEEPNSIDAYTEPGNGPPYEIRMSVKPVFDNWTGDGVEYYFCSKYDNAYYNIDMDRTDPANDKYDPTVSDPNYWMTDPSYDEENWQPDSWDIDTWDVALVGRDYTVRARERRSTGIRNITASAESKGSIFGKEYNPPDDGQWLAEYGPDMDGDGELDLITDGRPMLASQTQNSVTMTAMTVVDYDINGEPYTSATYEGGKQRVMYIFERKRNGISEAEHSTDGTDIEDIYGPTWTDTDLLENETYTYTVHTEDRPYGNVGGWSESVAVTIGIIDSELPEPNPAEFADPHPDTYLRRGYDLVLGFYDYIEAVIATDAPNPPGIGVWYQFEIDGAIQQWQISETLLREVSRNSVNTYRVRYRDNFIENVTGWSDPVTTIPIPSG